MNATPQPAIRARRTRFDLVATPSHWIDGDVQATHLMNVLHLLLPPGERWFCDVMREAIPQIDDDELRTVVKGFMGQEATHARAHDQGVAFLADRGMDVGRWVALAEHIRRAFGPRPFGRTLGPRAVGPWLRWRVATIAAVEHFTSVLGTWIVEESSALDDLADPAMLDLLRWHGAEEVEHRSVAFDLHEHLSGSYALRVGTMLPVVVSLTLIFRITTAYLLRLDPSHPGRFSSKTFRASVRKGHVPSAQAVLGSTRRYLRRDYHPSREPGSREVALEYLASSPGIDRRPAGRGKRVPAA